MSLSNDAAAMMRGILPLNDAVQAQLSSDLNKLGTIQSSLTRTMDAQELRYLAGRFPVTHGRWTFELNVDKMTDAKVVSGRTVAAGGEARYQVELSCKAGAITLAFVTFERKSDDGKRIPWSVEIATVTKRFGLRIGSERPYDAILVQNGYSNAGLVVVPGDFDSQLKVINSSRLVFADIFPADQVEVETNFPKEFQRLCVLIGNK